MPITAFPVSSRYGASHSSLIRALYAGELARHLQADDPNLRHLRPLFCRTDSWGPRLPERLRKQVKHLSPVMAVLLEETARLFSPLDPSGSTVECGVQVPRLDIDLRELPPLEWESVAWQAGRLAVDLHRFNLLGREIEPCNDFVHTKTVYVLTALQAFVVVSVHMYVNQVLRGLFSFPVTDGVTYKVPGLCFHRLKASKKSMTQKYVCLFTYLVERCAVCVNLLHEWQQPGFDSSRSSSWCELNRGIIIMRRELTTNPEKDA
ncbi:MAG: hypothetical protein KVP17_003167 [Porospora cf. gigantea B]|nr:MAG: hypothetical protein KVP17_003167 [Porospora cf. gigantea B]